MANYYSFGTQTLEKRKKLAIEDDEDGGRRSIAGMAQHSIPVSINRAPFKGNSLQFTLTNPLLKEIPLNFTFSILTKKIKSPSITREIPSKINRIKKKGSPKN